MATIRETPTADSLLVRRTLLARSIAARDIHAFSGTLISAGGGLPPIGEIGAARTLAVLHKRYKVLAVLTARIVHAATWSQVAAQLDVEPETAEALYADAESRWRGGDPQPWTPAVRAFAADQIDAAPIVIDTDAAAEAAAEALDAYLSTGTCGQDPTPR